MLLISFRKMVSPTTRFDRSENLLWWRLRRARKWWEFKLRECLTWTLTGWWKFSGKLPVSKHPPSSPSFLKNWRRGVLVSQPLMSRFTNNRDWRHGIYPLTSPIKTSTALASFIFTCSQIFLLSLIEQGIYFSLF